MLALFLTPSARFEIGLEPALRFQPALQRGFLVGFVLGDVIGARDADIHRIEGAAALFHLGLEDRDALGDRFERGELVEQEIIAALGDLADRVAGCRRPSTSADAAFAPSAARR